MEIAPCTLADLEDWAAMRIALWPDEPDLRAEAQAMLADPPVDVLNLICRVEGAPAGMAEASIRRDYVNGCETSPVVFLEGIYVAPGQRRTGIARALTARVAEWGRAHDCTELASDALLDNHASHVFHRAIGFAETERVVFFRRGL